MSTATPPPVALDPTVVAAAAAQGRRGALLLGIGVGTALLLGPVPIAVGLLLIESAPVLAGLLIAVGVLASVGGIVLMVLGTLALRRRMALLVGGGMPAPRPRPGLNVAQIVLGALLLVIGLFALGLANLVGSLESSSTASVVSAWLLAGVGVLGGAVLIVLGIVALVLHRRRAAS